MLGVVITNYNDSRFLINVVSKFALQEPDELIVVDDCSTDNSVEVLKELQKKYKFKIVLNDKANKGLFSATVKGVKSAKSNYITSWSTDDEPMPSFISEMRKAIKDYPYVDLFTSNAYVVRENQYYKKDLLPFDAYISPDYAVKIYSAGFGKNINTVGHTIKKDIILKCWEKGLKANFDGIYLWYAMFTKGFINIGSPLVIYHSYPNSHGASQKRKDIEVATNYAWLLYFDVPALWRRVAKSGVLSRESNFISWLGLRVIMYLPKFIREIIYKKYYGYSERIEKL